MIPTNTVSGGFTWCKLAHGRGYELTRNGECLGSLRRPSIWSSAYQAVTSTGNWTFRRSGFWGTGSEIVDSSQQVIATFKAAWHNRGTLIFADGQTFTLDCKGVWHPTWTIKSASGEFVLSLHSREKSVEVASGWAVNSDRLMLILIFALYRVLQAEEDAAAVAVAAAS